MQDLKVALEDREGAGQLDLAGVARVIGELPYGRPDVLSAAGVLDSGCGTCSTKHLLLVEIIRNHWPELRPQLWHRVYEVNREDARDRWSERVAAAVPATGLVDVHTYLTIETSDGRITVDVTFPIGQWDGHSSLPLACGSGADHPAGADPIASKAALVATHCNPPVREPFIAALSDAARSGELTSRTPPTTATAAARRPS